MKKTHKAGKTTDVNHYKNIFILLYVAIIVTAIAATSAITIGRTDYVLKLQITSVAADLNNQMKVNLSRYLSEVEMIGTLVFSEEYIYSYDASDPSNDEYESIKNEDNIENMLFSISMLENMIDFGIVYSNNHFVGKISNGTLRSFGTSLYTDFSAMIQDNTVNDGWQAGYNGNYSRIYYAKRVNPNAVLAVSFYSSELDDVFVRSSSTENIKVCITDSSNTIIYSQEYSEYGQKIDSMIADRMSMAHSGTYIDDKYLVAVNDCAEGWKIVQYAPVELILKEKNDVTYSLIIIGLVSVFIATVFSVIILERLITPVAATFTKLDDEAHTDLLTGVLNKRSFENYTEETLRGSSLSDRRAVVLLDIDNFKGVNDTLGHAYGDKVLTGVGDILRKVFGPDDFLGRLGGDEFCVLLCTDDETAGKYTSYNSYIEEKCTELCRAFAENYTGDDNSYKISASIGVAVFPSAGKSFGELYRCADEALYSSKHRGKDTFTIYSASDKEETE